MIRQNIFQLLGLLLLLLATSVFAVEGDESPKVEEVDCVNYTDAPDGRCIYQRVLKSQGFKLFVEAHGDDTLSANAVKIDARHYALINTDFHVYAPLADNDSIYLFRYKGAVSANDTVTVHNMDKVNSGETGLVNFGIRGLFPYVNVLVGTATSLSSEPNISRVYNFYVPALKYYVGGKEITDATKLQLEVGDSLQIDVEAVVTLGPNTNSVDTTVDKEKFYVSTFGESDSLIFKNLSGSNLEMVNGHPYVTFTKGKSSFWVYASASVTDGSKFTLSGYKKSDDPTKFFVEGPFPGDLRFGNPDLPYLENAVVFDTDGDGMGDSISVLFAGQMDSVDVKDFYYNWPTGDKFKKYSGDVDSTEFLFGLPDIDEVLQDKDASGELKAYVCSSVGNRCDTLRTSIKDSVGAVIQVATLVKGSGDTDTLVVRFNKVMDESWTEGEGLKLNGERIYGEAIQKEGNVWKFLVPSGVVSVGDKLKIETDCGKDACPDGILTAADGIPTSKNNQEVPVQNSGRIYMSENNGFYDRDGDGRLDSVSVGFETPITEDDLKNMNLTFYWLDNDGDVVALNPSPRDLTLSSDGTVLGFSIDPKSYDVMEKLTAVDSTRVSKKSSDKEYGYATLTNKVTIDGKDTTEEVRFEMNDYMAPVIASNFLTPESFQKMSPDKFVLTFSEPIDYEKFTMTEDCLSFYVDGEWKLYSLTSVEWSEGGRKATFYMEAGKNLDNRMNPADSVKFGNFEDGLVDKNGNHVSENAPTVMVEGDPRVIMQTTSFADFNRAEELSDRVKPFTIDHVKASLDEDNAASLGVLMDVGFSTIMNNDSGVTVLDLENSGLVWELYVYTNMGLYVGSASGKISCDDEFFDGNCFENPDKLYVRWNMRSDDGRRVGVGVYLAKFKVKVFGAKEEFLIERVFRWGITGSNK
ncbi:hypothetical protein [Fibrobacter sp. UWEL]|uniref:hypothetical protein n=1 Tax=Fibrobacter sp. UWEL TaxID=1896209 RepID=UPI00116041A0|nr:hypothetical protein [Fibrobacter sp. UWEL]